MKFNVKSALKNQVDYIVGELGKKDLTKMPLPELRNTINRLYELYPPKREHDIAITTLHKRFEENQRELRKKYKIDKLEETIKKYKEEQTTQIRGFMIQEIKGFKIENKCNTTKKS